MHVEFKQHLLPDSPAAAGADGSAGDPSDRPKAKLLTSAKHWPRMEPMVLGFFKATLTLVRTVTEKSLTAFILKHLKHYLPFLVPFPKVGVTSRRFFASCFFGILFEST